ncbi:MAG TPA: portal protein [Bryobacteraceae bacterium]|nr:portal protein [Bryobacteraceae bacterium]
MFPLPPRRRSGAHVTVEASAPAAPPSDRVRHDAFLRKVKERFQLAAEAESEIRQEALEDLDFYLGKQWPASIESDRLADQRPCLTINRLPQFIKQITNSQRENRPAIQVNPVGDGADQDTAEIYQGLTRHIEINSAADVAYDTAFEHAVIFGFGYFRVLTEYQDERSFDQEILIESIQNPFTVYLDPTAQKRDRSDAKWGFIVGDLLPDDYKAQYPHSELASLDEFSSLGDEGPLWFPGGKIRVAEYFEYEPEKATICELPDGSVVDQADLPAGVEPVQTRETERPRFHWYKLNAREVLDERVLAGRYLPVIGVYGEEINVNGKRVLRGVVRNQRDPQRQYNYMRSALVESIALAPKAPYVAEESQIEGHEQEWKNANVRAVAVLKYKAKTAGNNLLPPPQRNFGEAPIQAIAVAVAQADNDLKATAGIYDASLGERGPEQSGKAILARQKQGDVANFNFTDNLARSIKYLGKVLLDLEPKIYDRPGRVVRIVRPDETHETVTLNAPFVQKGLQKFYDLSTGRYDVTVSVGPSYQSKRQEAVASMVQLTQSYPQIMQIAGDLMVRNMDWPGASEIADRLKKTLPPALQEGDGQQMPIPPQVQTQLAQLTAMNQQLTAALNAATEDIKTKRLELESRERIAAMQAQASIVAAELRAKSSDAQALAKLDYESIQHRLELLHEAEQIGHEQEMAQPSAAEPQPPPAGQTEPQAA